MIGQVPCSNQAFETVGQRLYDCRCISKRRSRFLGPRQDQRLVSNPSQRGIRLANAALNLRSMRLYEFMGLREMLRDQRWVGRQHWTKRWRGSWRGWSVCATRAGQDACDEPRSPHALRICHSRRALSPVNIAGNFSSSLALLEVVDASGSFHLWSNKLCTCTLPCDRD